METLEGMEREAAASQEMSEQRAVFKLKELLDELRRRNWILIVWGPKDLPELVAATFKWSTSVDVLLLRNREDASAYRVPVVGDSSVFNPEIVVYQYHSSAIQTLRAILELPGPKEVGAPMETETPAEKCMIPVEELPTPVVIRPLSTYSR